MSVGEAGAEDNGLSLLAEVRNRLDELWQRRSAGIFRPGEQDEYRQLAWLERELYSLFGG